MTHPHVDAFIARATLWKPAFEHLRAQLLAAGLTEELKWGQPCYTHNGHHVALLQGFKGYCALLFPKGALLSNAHGALEPPGENSRVARRFRFTALDQIAARTEAIRAAIAEAILVEEAGLKVAETPEQEWPLELQAALAADAEFEKAFTALTPGRQRAYALHIGGAKQARTRESRVQKCRPAVLAGKGWNER